MTWNKALLAVLSVLATVLAMGLIPAPENVLVGVALAALGGGTTYAVPNATKSTPAVTTISGPGAP